MRMHKPNQIKVLWLPSLTPVSCDTAPSFDFYGNMYTVHTGKAIYIKLIIIVIIKILKIEWLKKTHYFHTDVYMYSHI